MKTTPIRRRTFGPVVARQLQQALAPITQTAFAAGLAWYLSRDLLGHHNPFFAPIAAAVCLWATNLVRAELAVEMMIGVALGIGVGTGVQPVLGDGPIAMAAAVLISLCVAVLVGQGFMRQRPMFVNQTTMSAILILAFPHTGLGPERLFDAAIGGGLAVVFSIVLFPKNPLNVLRDARLGVLAALRDILGQIGSGADASASPDPSWTLLAADRLHRHLARLIEARGTAIQLARVCPRRWPLRDATRAADRQAAQLALLGSSVLQLARTVTPPNDGMLVEPSHAAIRDLAEAGAALVDDQPAVAAAHARSARDHTAELRPTSHTTEQVLLAAVIDTCADELQQVVDLGGGVKRLG